MSAPQATIQLQREWRRSHCAVAAHEAPARCAARRPASDRNQGRLRRRRVRLVLGAHEWRAGEQLPRSRAAGRRREHPNRRRPRTRMAICIRLQQAFLAVRRRAVRHLHAGHVDGRGATARAQSASQRWPRFAKAWPAIFAAARDSCASSSRCRSAAAAQLHERAGRLMRGNAEAHELVAPGSLPRCSICLPPSPASGRRSPAALS